MRAHCVHQFGDSAHEDLRARLGDEVVLSFGPDIEGATEVRVLVAGRPSREHLEACAGLRAVVIPWAGVGKPTLELLADFPDVVLHNLHHNAGPTAEHALALLLTAAKRVIPNDRRMRAHDWKDRGRDQQATYLAGGRAVVLGMGAIGKRVAQLLRGIGMDVVGARARAVPGEQFEGMWVVGADVWREQLRDARALVVCVPLTDATRGLVGAEELALLAPNAVVVNVARGPVIDETALYEALRDGVIHGAGLDVWYRYPHPDDETSPPSEHPFEELDNVVMTPHRAGSTDATEGLRMGALAETLLAFARGTEVPYRVDPARGY
jgi:phosphoglycerate dehydrogenase-like enzyme